MKKLVVSLAVCLCLSELAAGDYVLISGNNDTGANGGQSMIRYSDNFQVVWERSPATSLAERYVCMIALSPTNGDVYSGNNNAPQLGEHISYVDGSYIGRAIPQPGQTDGTGKYTAPNVAIQDLKFGCDYNKDGVPDLWVLRRDMFEIYDGTTLDRTGDTGVADLLTSLSIPDSAGSSGVQDGTGGFGWTFGPDVTGDGVSDLFVLAGINANTNSRLVIWNPVTLKQVNVFNADGTKDNTQLAIGPDVDGDGRQDVWVTDPRNQRIRAYDYKTGALVASSVNLVSASDGITAVTLRFPTDIESCADGSLLVTTRFATSLDPDWAGAKDTNGGDLLKIQWDPAAKVGRASLLFESPKRIDGVAYVAVDKKAAGSPSPADGATDVSRDTLLGWTPGQYAATHDVYFGTSPTDVETASRANPLGLLVSQGQSAATFAPGRLEFGRTYYWRVDEVNAAPDNTIHAGKIWQFTVEPVAYRMSNITATASSSVNNMGPEKTINGSGLNAADQHGTTDTDMWLSSPGGAQPTWIQYQFDDVYKLHQMWVWNSNQILEDVLGFGVKTATIEYSLDGTSWTALQNVSEFAQGTGADDYAHNTTVDFGDVAARYVKITVTSGWGFLGQYGLSEVRFFYVPLQAGKPSPADAAINVKVDAMLSWQAGREAASHQLYLGTDANALPLVDTKTDTAYAPSLKLGTRYYWRVDEVNAAEAISPWTGKVWSFTTTSFIVVDDMESYNDTTQAIYQTWTDGYGTTTNGCLVGNDVAPFVNKTTVHGGVQSMPYRYGTTSTAAYSEAKRTFGTAQDWTPYGIKTLTVFFYGNTANTATSLYVKINGVKIAYSGDAANAAKAQWTQWDIDLTAVPAATLKGVQTLIVGAEGGSGTLLIDDIRLY